MQPHRRDVRAPHEVPIYEAEAVDVDGAATASLVRAARLAKDNRILPAGFAPAGRMPEGMSPRAVDPVGVEGDADFLPGTDTVRYRIQLPRADRGPLSVEAELLYQTIRPAHLRAMDAGASPEEARFLRLAPRHSVPVLIARAISTAAAPTR
jgi:hypothetical protein